MSETKQTIGEKYNLNNPDVRLTYTQAVNLAVDFKEFVNNDLSNFSTTDETMKRFVPFIHQLVSDNLSRIEEESVAQLFIDNADLTVSQKETAFDIEMFAVFPDNSVAEISSSEMNRGDWDRYENFPHAFLLQYERDTAEQYIHIYTAAFYNTDRQIFIRQGEKSPLTELLGYDPDKIDFSKIVGNIRRFDPSDKCDWDTMENDIFGTERAKIIYSNAVKKFLSITP